MNWDKIRDGFSSVSIQPLTEEPKLLGQSPSSSLTAVVDKDHPFADMKYNQELKRPTKLAKVHSQDKYDFENSTVKKYFKSVWEGEDLQIDWQERWDENDVYNNGLYLCLVANERARTKMIPEDELIDGKYALWMRFIQNPLSGIPKGDTAGPGRNANAAGLIVDVEPLKKHLTIPQRDSLMGRIRHHFLRQNANQLSMFFFDQMCFFLFEYYSQEKWYSEAVDVCMVMADTMLYGNKQSHPDQVLLMNKLGESLEGQGRYSEAATVYEDIGNHWNHLSNRYGSNPKFVPNPTQIWTNAGLAHKRAKNYSEAERCYVHALWIDINQHESLGVPQGLQPVADWTMDKGNACIALSNLISVYGQWHIVHYLKKANLIDETTAPDVSDLDSRGFPILNALAKMAGAPINLSISHANHSKCIEQVKNKFVATPAAAKLALYKSLVGGDEDGGSRVESFRKKLFSYHKAKKEFKVQLWDPKGYVAKLGIGRDGQKLDKNMARDTVLEGSNPEGITTGTRKCSQCDGIFDQSDIKLCPCKMIGYCGRECQLQHWKEHKKTCPVQRKKKSAK
eukprot:CAMPEP_0183737564 /NCGR_PEP_ID=MMETSP0737-20130205/52342_1 /TAXON_ID=385413 /ORGANISM="Thalassiosira miniscula, Strain CCMP1093" /LENGTH=564 /DNA_ID=CAMNT_0025971873 /DNA_START=92 /DNA_END=1786 /DNA_ORIENTATION=+